MSRARFALSLKPCPFCGGEVEDIEDDEMPNTFDIYCKTAGCYLEYGASWNFASRIKLAELWNKREGQS